MPKLIKIQNPKFIDEVEEIIDLREEFIYNENFLLYKYCMSMTYSDYNRT